MSSSKFNIQIIITVLLVSFCMAEDDNKRSNEMINKCWDKHEIYWKNRDSNIVVKKGDELQTIERFEKKYDVILPNDYKQSLLRNYHYSRRGRDGLRYSWFGDDIEINFLSINKIEKELIDLVQYVDFEESSNYKIYYFGNISKYLNKTWSRKWIPILERTDVDLDIYIDLDEDSPNYGKVIIFHPFIYLKEMGDHARFAVVADTYSKFFENIQKYMIQHGSVNNNYFEKLLYLPKDYWESDLYR